MRCFGGKLFFYTMTANAKLYNMTLVDSCEIPKAPEDFARSLKKLFLTLQNISYFVESIAKSNT